MYITTTVLRNQILDLNSRQKCPSAIHMQSEDCSCSEYRTCPFSSQTIIWQPLYPPDSYITFFNLNFGKFFNNRHQEKYIVWKPSKTVICCVFQPANACLRMSSHGRKRQKHSKMMKKVPFSSCTQEVHEKLTKKKVCWSAIGSDSQKLVDT